MTSTSSIITSRSAARRRRWGASGLVVAASATSAALLSAAGVIAASNGASSSSPAFLPPPPTPLGRRLAQRVASSGADASPILFEGVRRVGTKNTAVLARSTTTVLLHAAPTTTGSEYDSMTVPELKEALRSRGGRLSGKKSDLIERLEEMGDVDDDEAESSLSLSDDDGWEVSGIGGIEGVDFEDDSGGSAAAPPSIDLDFSLNASAKEDAGATAPHHVVDLPCPTLAAALEKKGVTAFLPVQSLSFDLIYGGGDAVLHAPTGSGKTLAFAVPLLGRLETEPRRRSNDQRGGSAKKSTTTTVAAPRVMVVAPSRELAKQLGKELSSLHPRKTNGVAVVFGGTPLERNVAALRSGRTRRGSGGGRGVDVVVGTAGRLRELVREGHLTFDSVEAMVLDEADTLLDFKDNPDVEKLLDLMEDREFQLVLSSATINKSVREYAVEVMDVDETSEAFVTVTSSPRGAADVNGDGDMSEAKGEALARKESSLPPQPSSKSDVTNERSSAEGAPPVRHWSVSARAGPIRSSVVSDLIATLRPRISIIFIPTKAEVESVGAALSAYHGGVLDVRVLHGDMVQSARTRTLTLLRDGHESRQRVLVATDVASRGLDLEGVDLVVQFGVPRKNGKEGTFDAELYAHRTGRAGRFAGGGGGREGKRASRTAADAVTLYDPTKGEFKVLRSLREELRSAWSFDVWERYPPSPSDVMDAAFRSASERCDEADEEVVQFFREKLASSDDRASTDVFDSLARAMAALSGLDEAAPQRSLLTADPKQRTVRARKFGTGGGAEQSPGVVPATPPEITKLCKGLGTGKIGRVAIRDDGSAIFDLPAKKAERIVGTLAESADRMADDGEWQMDLPTALFT